MSTFKQCPRKYFRLRVVKDVKESDTEATLYGSEVHKAAEEYIRDGKEIPAKFIFIKEYLDILNKIDGEKLCEYKMGLTKELEPCEFFDENVWWRGIADLIVLSGTTAYLVDYKTGKSAKYADTKQLEMLAMALFRHFPQIEDVKAGLLFVVSKEFIQSEYNREQQKDSWLTIFGDVHMLEACYENDVWNPKPNFSCNKFCPVLDCEHNGMNSRR